jgi:L-fuconolactonase
MLKIDAHQHFWKFDPIRHNWINDEMKIIQRDFLPNYLELILKENGFDGCVTVQADQSEAENELLLEYAKEHEFIKGVVGWTDLQAPDLEERLAYYKEFKKLKGFRHVLQGEPQRDLMLTSKFKNGIGLLGQSGFTYDILIYPDQLKFSTELVSLFPNQPFVVDHIAKPNIKGKEIIEWEKDIRAIAERDNVYCKLSGMITEADWKTWKLEDFTPYLDCVVEAFGINRLMFGSDWPVCLLAGSYGEMLEVVTNYFFHFSESEKDQLFGGNAIKFYDL